MTYCNVNCICEHQACPSNYCKSSELICMFRKSSTRVCMCDIYSIIIESDICILVHLIKTFWKKLIDELPLNFTLRSNSVWDKVHVSSVSPSLARESQWRLAFGWMAAILFIACAAMLLDRAAYLLFFLPKTPCCCGLGYASWFSEAKSYKAAQSTLSSTQNSAIESVEVHSIKPILALPRIYLDPSKDACESPSEHVRTLQRRNGNVRKRFKYIGGERQAKTKALLPKLIIDESSSHSNTDGVMVRVRKEKVFLGLSGHVTLTWFRQVG